MSKGIDYGCGQTNIDTETGIRFGVIPVNEVTQAWCDSSEADYGRATCPKCERDIDDNPVDIGYRCKNCRRSFASDKCLPDEALSYYVDDDEYNAASDSNGDIFITKSPWYTKAAFCSPCAPGACYLMSPCDDGNKAYCFGHDWFEGGVAPYPVYSVADDHLACNCVNAACATQPGYCGAYRSNFMKCPGCGESIIDKTCGNRECEVYQEAVLVHSHNSTHHGNLMHIGCPLCKEEYPELVEPTKDSMHPQGL